MCVVELSSGVLVLLWVFIFVALVLRLLCLFTGDFVVAVWM